jgi:Fur family iron response transcriptional regulator
MNRQTVEYGLNADQIRDLLTRYQITPTRQRLEIAQHMFQRPQHLSAEKILEGVNHDGCRVSRATVYNTMGLFASKGLVREVLIDRERVFYDSNNSAHHHIYNLDTGDLYDVDGVSLDIANIPGLSENLKVVDTDLIIRVSQRQEK